MRLEIALRPGGGRYEVLVSDRHAHPEFAPFGKDVGQGLDPALFGHVPGKLGDTKVPQLPVLPPPHGRFQSGDHQAPDQPATDVWIVKNIPGDE